MSTFILGAEGAMRKIVHMHRSTIVELEDDRACADEGGYPPGYGWRVNQGRYIEPAPRKKKDEVSPGAQVAGVLLAVSIGLVGACALIAWWTS